MSRSTLRRLAGLQPGEGRPAALAGLMFFCLMCAYFILKPLRDEMGIAGGVRNLPHLYLVTLGVMLVIAPALAAVSRRRRREVFLPLIYRFLSLNLFVFFGLLMALPTTEVWLGRVFYVWVSVYNLFSLSLFWGFLADGSGFRHGRRLFGVVAVGGTAGAILGSMLTDVLVGPLGRVPLLLVSLLFLEAAIRLIGPLSRDFRAIEDPADVSPSAPAVGESVWSGIGLVLRSPYLQAICAFLLLYSLSSTFLYFAQANIVAEAADGRAARAQLLARIEIWVQSATLITQLTVTGRLLRRLGTGPVLATLPVLTAAGFAVLARSPGLITLVVVQVLRRTLNYALVKPARESLYTPLQPAAQYRAKNFIDTFVYRGGDALGAGAYDLLTGAGLGVAGIATVAVPVAIVWGVVAVHLGHRQRRLAAGRDDHDPALGSPRALASRPAGAAG